MSCSIEILRLDEANVEPHHIVGFIHVYQDAFSGPPWFENHPTKRVYEMVFLEHLPHCLVLALDGREVVGLACCHPVLAEVNTGNHVREFLTAHREIAPFPLEQTIYQSEVAVLSSYRRQHIAEKLTLARFDWARGQGLTHYTMRTEPNGSLSKPLYEKLGARIAKGLVQPISPGADEVKSESKERIYLWGKL